MMHPPSPQAAAAVADPARRKRKRPTMSNETDVACEAREEPVAAAPRGPFRGKCLYQSRKCDNERALKRNGKPHNLCDEHRNKQNQHQRKFDAKKYTRKKRKHSDSESGDDHEHEHEHDQDDVKHEAPEPVAKSGKRRAKHKRSKASPTADQTAFPMPHESEYAHPSHGSDARPLEIRRPPALDLVRSSPPSGYGLPPVHHTRSPPSAEFVPSGILVPPVTPVDSARPFPSPHGMTIAYPFLRPPPPQGSRSRSFDAGVTRISPMGGAAPGAMPFERMQPPPSVQHKLPSLQELPLGQLTRSLSEQTAHARSVMTASSAQTLPLTSLLTHQRPSQWIGSPVLPPLAPLRLNSTSPPAQQRPYLPRPPY